MPLGGWLAQKCSGRLLMLMGSSVSISTTVLASLCSQDSFMTFFVLFVGGQAFCLGFSYMVPLQLGWKACPDNAGLASGIIVGGFGLGALIFSYLAAKIVNPYNLSSSVNEQGLIVFDEAVTSQVPHMI